jgi:cell wall-associated NlpC family hydrolase
MLRVGSSGTQVAKLQNELKAAGFNPGPIDGEFGPRTAAAVKSYQRRNQLDVDGIVGPRTWKALSTDQYTAPSGAHGRPQPAPRPVGHVPAPAPSAGASGKVDAMLNEARSHLGFHEGAGNSNPFSHALGRPSEAWCADFVSYCAQKAGLHMNTASAQGVADALKARGTWKGRNNPQPGDAVTFRWDGSHGWADHVGMVEKVFTRNGRLYVQTIEGNSSDQVRRKVYPASSSVINGFGRLT